MYVIDVVVQFGGNSFGIQLYSPWESFDRLSAYHIQHIGYASNEQFHLRRGMLWREAIDHLWMLMISYAGQHPTPAEMVDVEGEICTAPCWLIEDAPVAFAKKCECGAEKARTTHSAWCPKH